MATRMQQRRGLASAWTAANTVLAAGEVGFEIDNAQFKVGDGTTAWADLPYFNNYDAVVEAISSAILQEVSDRDTAINTVLEGTVATDISAAITTANDYADEIMEAEVISRNSAISTASNTANTTAQGYVDTHASDTTNVHGISDTSDLASATTLTAHINDTTGVHGITDTSDLQLASTAATTYVKFEPSTTQVIKGNTRFEPFLAAGKPLTVKGASSQTGNLTEWKDSADTVLAHVDASGNIYTNGDITVDGDLVVNGTTTTVNTSNFETSDALIYIGEGNVGNTIDLGFVASYNDGTYHHAGLARDASDNKWKLFSSVEDEPTTTINFSQAEYDTLVVGGIEFSDGVQVKQGIPSLTTINQQTSSYTPVITDRDKLVEINSSSGVTLTIPTNASVAYPVGTSFDILQTGTGQVTIAGDSGVTVNSTPGLKLRTQWSSATLFKRGTDTWVVYGDLSA